MIRVIQRIARRSGERIETDVPGIVFLEIDGLAKPVLQRAMRDGNASTMARWLADGSHRFLEWETDLSSQTGASQAGILLGSNDDIPAFRWVEKERGTVMACSAPADCAEIERRLAGDGLLRNGGASRGNLLSGEADHLILTVSRMEAEKGRTRVTARSSRTRTTSPASLVLFFWEVILEWVAALRAIRRDVQPRGHRGGHLPVHARRDVRDRPRPHRVRRPHGPDEGARGGVRDLLELRRGRAPLRARACGHARGPAEARPAVRAHRPRAPLRATAVRDRRSFRSRSDTGSNLQAAERLRPRRPRLRSLQEGDVAEIAGGDEQSAMVGHASKEATGKEPKRPKNDVSDRQVVVLGSGNLGLVYLMEEPRRLTLEEIEERHPRLLPALREHPHVGWLLVRSSEHGAVVLGGNGTRYLADDRVDGEDPLASFSPTAHLHLRRTDGFSNVADIMVGSFYDPDLDEGCAFEELISFHGGLGGLQTRPFILFPRQMPVPEGPILGAAAVHQLLKRWRAPMEGPSQRLLLRTGARGRPAIAAGRPT